MTSRRDELLHPIPQMTTSELRELRRALEERMAMATLPRFSRPREELRQQLAEIAAEEDERARIRRPDRHA